MIKEIIEGNEVDLKSPEFYINRELSLIEFNRRVLEQAKIEDTPLLERLRFLCISSTNLDEFFEIRVSGLKHKTDTELVGVGLDGLSSQDALIEIRVRVEQLIEAQYETLNEVLLPQLEQEGIRFIRRSEWNEEQSEWLYKYFQDSLLPVLTPMGLDPAHPFPRILNKTLSFIISLEGKDAFGRNCDMAVVQAPRSLPRLIQIPDSINNTGKHDFVFLSSIIHAYVDELFHGMKVKGTFQLRITRNSDLFVDEEEVNLLRAMEGELLSRRYGDIVRIEIDKDAPDDIVHFLLKNFNINESLIYKVNGPVNLGRLMQICNLDGRGDLRYPAFTPKVPGKLGKGSDIFAVLRKQDILLHHPYESFKPVVDLLRQAAVDSKVLVIKQTLYRTGPDSIVADVLVEAARAGKEVIVVIEIRARFDEADNIALANRLQEAGAHVVYGVVGYKTHAKMMLIVRREGKVLRNYVHMGTGNYHPVTAQVYTDYGLFTSDAKIGEDVHKVFMQLTSLGKVSKLHKLLQAPFTLHAALLKKINNETSNASKGKPARIIAKMNALIEPGIIQALYRASIAGVKIELIVRGVCSLRPGIPGVSENIQVRSIVGRFLEHTRVFYFQNKDEPEVYCSSADWMERNMFHRVEICFPIQTKRISNEIIKHLEYCLKDNKQSWILQSDGSYQRLENDEEPFVAQEQLLEDLSKH
ncbi:MAG: polyphosphate kinase 1 [Gammaproteobacteria bacterium]|nr:polyphosphate kinase 1 [Gammaproteobacteria bacterium]